MGVSAVGSLGGEFEAWVAQCRPHPLLPWQSYVAGRALEVDGQGRLVHRRVGVSVPRQVGKSHFLRDLALWRLHQADRFGEPQTVLHVAHALTVTEEVFLPALEWAKGRGYKVREANGQMRIEHEGNRWLPRSTQTGYGFTLSLALVDEAWAVEPRRVDSGLAPTLSARTGGQVWLFSSANEQATALFPRFREARRDGWLLLEWSAPEGSDPGDEGVWAAASPVPITAERRELMRDELVSDRGTFMLERLNMWPPSVAVSWGSVLAPLVAVGAPVWSGPLVGAVEADPEVHGGLWGAAVSDGTCVESVVVESLGKALGWLEARSPGRVLAHQSVVQRLDGVWRDRVDAVSLMQARAATAVLRDRCRAGGVRGWGAWVDALPRVEVSGAAGLEVIDNRRSRGPVGVVKAAAWALWGASVQPGVEPAIF